MKIIDKFYSFIYIVMAKHCKDCPDKNNEILELENVKVEKKDKKKAFFFPNEWVRIEADSYEEALEILHNKDN